MNEWTVEKIITFSSGIMGGRRLPESVARSLIEEEPEDMPQAIEDAAYDLRAEEQADYPGGRR